MELDILLQRPRVNRLYRLIKVQIVQRVWHDWRKVLELCPVRLNRFGTGQSVNESVKSKI